MTDAQRRMLHLITRGPRYSLPQARQVNPRSRIGSDVLDLDVTGVEEKALVLVLVRDLAYEVAGVFAEVLCYIEFVKRLTDAQTEVLLQTGGKMDKRMDRQMDKERLKIKSSVL